MVWLYSHSLCWNVLPFFGDFFSILWYIVSDFCKGRPEKNYHLETMACLLKTRALRISRFFAFCSPLFTLQSWRNSYPHSKQFHRNKQTKKKIEMIEKQHVNKLLTASFFVEGRIMLLLFISLNFIQINDHFHVVFSKINILEFGQRCSFLCKPV